MPFFSRPLGRMAKIIGRSTTGKKTAPLLDDDEYEARVVRYSGDRAILRPPELRYWLRPKQLPISAETVFLSRFREDPQAFFRMSKGSTTIDDAWNELSPRKRQRYIAEAKENEIRNTAENAELNKRCPLSPSVEDVSSIRTPTISIFGPHYEPEYLFTSRRIALQRWQRYRCDYPAACGGNKTIVPEKPFRIMGLPFELRREIFSLVLRQSYPVLQFPSDESADAFHGPVDVRLFAVSRQVFAEAVKVFYEENTFSMSTAPSSYFKAMPLFMRQSAGSEEPRPTNSIRRVHVMFRFRDSASPDTDEFRFLWKKFCEFLKTCSNLRTVELSVRCPLTYFDATPELQIDKLIEMLTSTREVIANISDVTTDGRHEYNGRLIDIHCRVRQIRVIMN